MSFGRAAAGAVLTGGESRRMGSDKALVEVAGRPLVVHVADALWEAGCHPVWCQGGDRPALEALGLTVVDDEMPGAGPVVATLAALRYAGTDVLVVACDLADITADVVRQVSGRAVDDRVRVAVADDKHHLLARWPASTAEQLGHLVDEGVRSYRDVLSRLDVVEVAVPESSVRNVNEPGDVDPRR